MRCNNCGYIYDENTYQSCPNCNAPLYQFHQNNPNPANNQYPQYPPYQVVPQSYGFQEKKKHTFIKVIAIIVAIIVLFGFCSHFLTIENTDNTSKENVDFSFAVNEQTLINQNGILVKVTGAENSEDNIGLNIFIENNSKYSYSVTILKSAINDIMVYGDYKSSVDSSSISISSYALETTIHSGNTAQTKYIVSKEWCKEHGVDTINSFSLLFDFEDVGEKSYNSFSTGVIKIKTTNYTQNNTIPKDTRYEDDNIKIYLIEHKDNSITLGVYNKTNINIEYDLKSVSINNFSYDEKNLVIDEPVFVEHISYLKLRIDDDFLKKNSIETIEELECQLEIEIKNNNHDYYNTDIIEIQL